MANSYNIIYSDNFAFVDLKKKRSNYFLSGYTTNDILKTSPKADTIKLGKRVLKENTLS